LASVVSTDTLVSHVSKAIAACAAFFFNSWFIRVSRLFHKANQEVSEQSAVAKPLDDNGDNAPGKELCQQEEASKSSK